MSLSINYGVGSSGARTANVTNGKIHLVVVAHDLGATNETVSGWDVLFTGDKEGKPDFSKILNSSYLGDGEEDFEEIVETFAHRLDAGIEPADMFNDIEEGTVNTMERIASEMKAAERKE